MKKILVIANWKMNPQSLKGAKLLFDSVAKGIKNVKRTEVVICPPFIYLAPLVEFLYRCRKSQLLALGGQDVFYEEKGAFTGEISPLMLKNLGCQYVIIGHSERRKFGETDEMINKKIKAAISVKLKPILCIGETEKEREKGETFKILKNQLQEDLKEIENLIVAYEPVWAIGTGKACSPVEAKKANFFIKKLLPDIPVLYGGSVNSQNAANYIKDYNPPTTLPSKGRAPAEFEGLLVGGASLDSKEFIEIVKKVSSQG